MNNRDKNIPHLPCPLLPLHSKLHLQGDGPSVLFIVICTSHFAIEQIVVHALGDCSRQFMAQQERSRR
jgi:hypothetical protein